MAEPAARRRGGRRAGQAAPASRNRRLSALQAALERAVVDLGGCGVRFAPVGGLAVSARCEPRFTRDIDLAVAVASDAEAEGVVRRLMQCGYRVLATARRGGEQRLGLPVQARHR